VIIIERNLRFVVQKQLAIPWTELHACMLRWRLTTNRTTRATHAKAHAQVRCTRPVHANHHKSLHRYPL